MSNPPLDIYALLGLDEAASNEDVKRAYKKMARKLHPDVSSGTEKAMSELNSAYAYYQAWYAEKLLDEADPVFFTSTVAPPKPEAPTPTPTPVYTPPPPTTAPHRTTTPTAHKAPSGPPTMPTASHTPTAPRIPRMPPPTRNTVPPVAPAANTAKSAPAKRAMPTRTNPAHANARRRRNRIRLGAVIGILVIAFVAWNNLSRTGSDQTISSSAAIAPAVEATIAPAPTPEVPVDTAPPSTPEPPAAPPAPTIQQLTASAQAQINKEIAGLSLDCIATVLCPRYPVGFASYIPVIVKGLDNNMLITLEQWGYHDKWTDNHGQVVSSFGGPSGIKAEIVTAYDAAGDFDAGLVYHEMSGAGIPNVKPNTDIVWPSGRPWTINWSLIDRSGRVVRRLSYTAQTYSFNINIDCGATPPPKARECDIRAVTLNTPWGPLRTIKRPTPTEVIEIPTPSS